MDIKDRLQTKLNLVGFTLKEISEYINDLLIENEKLRKRVAELEGNHNDER